MAEDGRLALLGELERTDEAIGVELAELDELSAAVASIHGRAIALQELVARLPEERKAAAAAVDEAEQALAEARDALRRAADELAAAEAGQDAERIAAARRFEVRARDHLHITERKAAAAREHASELASRADAARLEAEELEARAQELADVLEERPRLTEEAVAGPDAGLEGLADWGTRVRAALLVARSQLAAERDAVVRQANELGAVLLGEELPATSAASVARRVERELGSR
jgi:fused signal recognition particle receptor